MHLPSLQRPSSVLLAISAITVGILTAAVVFLESVMPAVQAFAISFLVLGPLLGVLLYEATRQFATAVPDNCATVGGLTRVVQAHNLPAHQHLNQGWSRGDVWGTMCVIISEQLAVPLDQIQYESSFVEDLGAT